MTLVHPAEKVLDWITPRERRFTRPRSTASRDRPFQRFKGKFAPENAVRKRMRRPRKIEHGLWRMLQKFMPAIPWWMTTPAVVSPCVHPRRLRFAVAYLNIDSAWWFFNFVGSFLTFLHYILTCEKVEFIANGKGSPRVSKWSKALELEYISSNHIIYLSSDLWQEFPNLFGSQFGKHC